MDKHETEVREEDGERVVVMTDEMLAELGAEAGDYVEISERHGVMWIETPAGAVTVRRESD